MGLLGILFALGLLIWLAYRGWSVLLLAPATALVAAAVAREPLLAVHIVFGDEGASRRSPSRLYLKRTWQARRCSAYPRSRDRLARLKISQDPEAGRSGDEVL